MVGARTLGDRLGARDDDAFVGRRRELIEIEAMFEEGAQSSVALVHGPGGVGKSALLREVARRGTARGLTPVRVEGRDVPPDPEILGMVLAPAREQPRPLVLIDTYERLAPLDTVLRNELLPALPADSVVVLAGRRAPGPGWSEGGWEHLALDVELRELDAGDALALLDRRGVEAAVASDIRGWAGGSPLALTLAAETGRRDGWERATRLESPELVRRLVDRLVEVQADPLRRRALEVAAIARVVTPGMLADVLELAEDDARALHTWLEAVAITEPLGGGLAMHDLAARALGAELRRREPVRDRALRRGVIDHLHARAVAGDLGLSLDLGALADEPVRREAWLPDPELDAWVSGLRPRDAAELAALTRERHGPEAGDALARLLAGAPTVAGVARDSAGDLLGFYVSVGLDAAAPAARADPLVDRCLRHAREHGHAEAAVVMRDQFVAGGHAGRGVPALLNLAGFLRAGVANPRCVYGFAEHADELSRAFLEQLGATRVPELDASYAEAWLLDYGQAGFLDWMRDDLYRQLGLAAPSASAPEALDAAVVRAVLDAWHDPLRLAESPLATGDGVEARCAAARERLREGIDRAFADTEADVLLRRVVELTYIDPAPGGRDGVAAALHLSRSHYFRLRATAFERIASALGPNEPGVP